MRVGSGAGLVAVLAAVLAACGQPMPDNKAAQANALESEAAAGDTDGNATDIGMGKANGSPRPAADGGSSAMPVPGTNTPEHIVVNMDQTADNSDGL